jgi:hypothetical protein
MIDQSIKARIDAMDRDEMERRYRFDPVNSDLFKGKNGLYFAQRYILLGGKPVDSFIIKD